MGRPKEMILTPQREVILDELRSSQDHPTAEEIFQRIRKKLPRVSLATVYRNLETMSRAGIIRKVETAGPKMRFDGNMFPHFHMRCVRCARVMDAPWELREIASRIPQEIQGHQVIGHNLELVVLCSSCKRC
ncbi:MAG: transcriptional repressor [bacterium]